MSRQQSRIAEPKKVNSELFNLTYGALVSNLVKDYENVEEVNKHLERMGHNIGVRLIDDYLARSNCSRCHDLREAAEKIQSAFKLYLNISPSISNWTSDEFSLIFDCAPFSDYVELPDNLINLKYSNILPGVIQGACRMVQLEVQTWIQQDILKGDKETEIKVKFIKKLEDSMPSGED